MWSSDYDERDRLFSEALKTLTRANKSNLIMPLCRRMDRCAGDRVANFNTLCRKLIQRYSNPNKQHLPLAWA